MTEPASQRRLCPTRANGANSLIAHWISADVCLTRQRQGYHKCYTCAYRGLPASAVLPVSARVVEPRASSESGERREP